MKREYLLQDQQVFIEKRGAVRLKKSDAVEVKVWLKGIADKSCEKRYQVE